MRLAGALLLAACASSAAAPSSCSQARYCDAAPNCTKAGATEADGLALLDAHEQL